MAAPEAAGEIARMERVSDTPRPITAAETAPKRDSTFVDSNGEGSFYTGSRIDAISAHAHQRNR